MTQEEASKLAHAIRFIDSGCDTCIRNFCNKLNSSNLGFNWIVGSGESIIIQPDWSDDPEDAFQMSLPTVTAEPSK